MNKHLFRVIFNKARGLLMVVAENVRSGKKSGASTAGSSASASGGGFAVTLDPLRYALMLVLGLILPNAALAAIVADASAPAGQQPTVITTANGVLQVDIQTPSAAGVSRNTYSQFDVDRQGAILNNSRVDVQSQLGGWITGNQRLNDGTARIILNEVNSSAASLLNGYIEVAGDRAQVVIANPAGISCAGCGFINADRATLTTGTPILSDGRLDGYTVSRGEVSINGDGLDGRTTEYTDIIARSVRINASIWANDLHVTTGANRVSADQSQVVPIANLDAKPEFAIDVAQLGGMYAGKIRLVGTEHGVGVRNAGTLAAESGGLKVTLDGRLENTGVLQSKQDIRLATEGGVRNAGTLAAKRELLLSTGADLDNSSGQINAGRLDITARSMQNRDGDLEQTGAQTLAIISESLTNREAGRIGVAETPSGSGGDDGGSSGGTPTGPDVGTTPPSSGEGTEGNTPEPEQVVKLADGQLLIGKLLDNDAGRILAGGKVTLSSQNLNNDGGRLGAHQFTLGGGEFSNQAGELIVTTSADISATRMNNDHGKLSVGGTLDLIADQFSNRGGELTHSHTSATALQVTGRFDNTGGVLATNADSLTLTAAVLVNEDGRLEHVGAGTLAIEAGSLEGRGGSLLSNGAMEISGESTDLSAGTTSARRIAIDTGTLTTAQGTLVATGEEALMLKARDVLNNDGGTLATNGMLSLDAGALSNREGLISVSGSAASEIQVTGTVDNSAGVLTSTGALSLETGDLLNTEGLVHTAAGSALRLQVEGTLNNSSNGALVSGEALHVSSYELNNQSGLIQAQGDATVQAERVDNSAGLILSTQTLALESQTLINRATSSADDQALGLQGETVAITANQLDNNSGVISAEQTLSFTGTGASSTLSNEGGSLASSGSINVLVDKLFNAGGTVLAGIDNIIKTGTLTGAGRLLSHGDLSLEVSQDFVQAGEIVANGQADITSEGRLTNRGSIEAGTLHVRAANIDNTATGEISGGNVQVSAISTLTNRGLIDGQQTQVDATRVENIGTGRIYGDHLAIQALTLINREETVGGATQAGTIAARERLDLGVATLINQEQALIFSAGSGDNALNIGGALDENGWALGRADFVHNASATIESLGGLSLAATRLLNSNEHFATIEARTLAPTAITYIRPDGDANKYEISNFVWRSWSRAGYYRWKDDPDIGESGMLGKSPIPRVGENDCIGEGDAEVCVRLPGADYLADDPAWAYFKLQAPNKEPSEPVSTDFEEDEDYKTALAAWRTAHAAWQAETDARYEVLDARIETYNNQFESRRIKAWTQYKVTRTEHTTQVTESAPALIRSGGNMRLIGDELVNDKSRIVAGGALTGDLQSLRNIDAIGQHRVHEEGTSQSSRSRWRGGFKRYHERRWGDLTSYRPADIVTHFNLNVVGVETNTQTQGSGSHIATRSTTEVKDSFNGSAVPLLISKLPQGPVEPSAAPESVGPVGSVWDLPTSSLFKVSPGSGSFLVETDPRFTNQRTWLNSDYLLGQLSLDAAGMQQRIGDGFYEQWLIREQVSQLTGRRYLDGYADDEAQYRSLMESGITVALDWNLRPGVALSDEQVARLTSDIVWLVEETVRLPDGTLTTALVPKVYLVPREGDLDGNGTLISADSIDLRLEGDLVNSGTIAGRSVVQLSGDNLRNLDGRITGADVLMQARTDLDNIGGRIDAQDSLLLSAGRDLTVASTTHSEQNEGGNWSASRTNLDRVAGLYVSNPGGTLALAAGQDITLAGAEVVNDGANSQTLVAAGRDLTLAAVHTENQHESSERLDKPKGPFAELFQNRPGDTHRESQSQDIGTTLRTGGDLTLQAGGDLFAQAAQVRVGGDLQASAGGDLLIVSGSQSASYSLDGEGVTVEAQESIQRSSGFNVTGDMQLTAGNDLLLMASQLKAGGDASLTAGNDLTLLAGQNYSYSLTDYQHSGSFGRKTQQRDEVTDLSHVGSSIVSGGNLSLESGGDQRYQAANLQSDGDLTLDSGGAIAFEGVKDMHQENHISSSNDWSWMKSSGEGWTDETLRQSALVAQGNLVIKAVEGISLDIKEIDEHSVSQTIDAMVEADPQLAWLKEMEQRGDIDWQRVKELHDSYEYDQQGMGPAAALAVAIAVTYFTAGAGTSLTGGALASGINAATAAGVQAVAVQGAMSAINNGGDIDVVFKDVTSTDNLKGYATTMVTAGLTAGLYDQMLGTKTLQSGKVVTDLSSRGGIARFAGNQILQSTTQVAVSKALGQNASFNGLLKESLIDTFTAAGFNLVGDIGEEYKLATGGSEMIALHALMGGLAAKAQGGEFATGALAAGANKALVSNLHGQFEGMDQKEQERLLLATSQLVGLLTAAVQDLDGDGSQLSMGANIAKDATQYNDFLHGFIPQGLTEYGSAATSLATHMTENGATPDEISQALHEYSMGDLPESADIISAYGTAYAYLLGGGAVVATAPLTSGWLLLGGALIGGGANVGTTLALGNKIDLSSSDFWVDFTMATAVGALTQGRGPLGTVGVSLYGATLGSYLKAENPLPAQAGSLAGSVPGYYLGRGVIKYGAPYVGTASQVYGQVLGGVTSEVISSKVKDIVSSAQ